METDVHHYILDQVQDSARERLAKLLELNAPGVIVWHTALLFDPALELFPNSRPQRELYGKYRNEALIAEPEKKGRCWYLRTDKGVLRYFPKGRWGRYIREGENVDISDKNRKCPKKVEKAKVFRNMTEESIKS